MKTELKPCPFCGGEAIIINVEPHKHYTVDLPDYPGGSFIECNGCTCALAGRTEAETIKAWNRRTEVTNE